MNSFFFFSDPRKPIPTLPFKSRSCAANYLLICIHMYTYMDIHIQICIHMETQSIYVYTYMDWVYLHICIHIYGLGFLLIFTNPDYCPHNKFVAQVLGHISEYMYINVWILFPSLGSRGHPREPRLAPTLKVYVAQLLGHTSEYRYINIWILCSRIHLDVGI